MLAYLPAQKEPEKTHPGRARRECCVHKRVSGGIATIEEEEEKEKEKINNRGGEEEEEEEEELIKDLKWSNPLETVNRYRPLPLIQFQLCTGEWHCQGIIRWGIIRCVTLGTVAT